MLGLNHAVCKLLIIGANGLRRINRLHASALPVHCAIAPFWAAALHWRLYVFSMS
jgi:hypothetical protein